MRLLTKLWNWFLALFNLGEDTMPLVEEDLPLSDIEKIIFQETADLSNIFVYTFDEDNYNREEDWRIPEIRDDGKVYDDCDGYALYLWKKLQDYGIESNVIFCEIPVKEGYGGHAVLYSNEWLMDCNHWLPFRKTDVPNWKWIRMSDPYMSLDGWRDIDE